ncbi:hypothetical protein LBMAG42_57120 [Deltaproteobacteria bacterium]|nr:hypothetical protein LBMAG42_57120 [Deltaproteobacteria bacterium]
MESQYLVSAKKRGRLERSWAEPFRTVVLPLIDEELFRACFDEANGRPNTSIRLLVGLHLLKEADDLTDAQVLDALEFNIQWQYALGVAPADAHVCEKTLHNFRHKLMENERATAVFQRLTEALMRVDGLSSVRQRLDSTHVISDIAVLTRLGLFTETVTHFLRELRREAAPKLAKRYLDREGYFSDATREQAPRRLVVVAQDLYRLVASFEADAETAAMPAYLLLVRLLAEQCDVVHGDQGEPGNVLVKEPKAVGGGSLQSPHDPDATYGHKGKGYEVQLAETCVAKNPYQVVTVVSVNAANVSDQHATVPVVEELVDRGLVPDVLIADTAYGSGENLVACAELGVRLLAPVQDPTAAAEKKAVEAEVAPSAVAPTQAVAPDSTSGDEESPRAPLPLGLADFTFNATHSEVLRCPSGQAALSNIVRASLMGFEATFAESACAACPLAPRCPTRSPRRADGDRVLAFRDVTAATASRQREQQTPAFRTDYKLRSGIESTNAEVKGRHGAGGLRVRGGARVKLAVVLKVMALNVKRAVQHHTEALREPNGGDDRLQVEAA